MKKPLTTYRPRLTESRTAIREHLTTFNCVGRAERVGYNVRYADVAQLVERDLAKVEVAGSSPVVRSIIS
jgi:hypothetical protein